MNGFCHIEIPTTDPEKSRQFYEQVFDWDIEELPEMNYLMFKAPEGPGGGLVKMDSIPEETGMMNFICVEDIEETLDKIAQHGGEILEEKTEFGSFGWDAKFADPCGVILGIWQSAETENEE